MDFLPAQKLLAEIAFRKDFNYLADKVKKKKQIF